MNKRKVCVMKGCGTTPSRIMADIADALAATGCETLVLDPESEGVCAAPTADARVASIRELAAKIHAFGPHFALSYATTGLLDPMLDEGGLFEIIKVPYAILYYDAPFQDASFYASFGRSDLLTVVCWDRSYLEWFGTFGARRVFYLPLATNARVFTPPLAPATSRTRLSFVGSLESHHPRSDFDGNAVMQAIRDHGVALKLQHPCEPFDKLLARLQKDMSGQLDACRQHADVNRLLQDVVAGADVEYRRQAIAAAANLGVTVYGGTDWTHARIAGLDLRDPVPYGPELAQVYASSDINLNFTRTQLRTAVNQRVFDCPAAGGFVLSDYRADLESLFEAGTESDWFSSLDEMTQKIERYTRDAAARRRMAERAREKVLAAHTWDHRARELVRIMTQS